MADATGRKGRVVRHHRFAKQGLSDRSAEQIRDLGHLVARVQSALSNQDRDLPPAVQDIGGGASWSLGGWLTTGIHEDDVRAPGLPIERLSAASRIICVSFDTVR